MNNPENDNRVKSDETIMIDREAYYLDEYIMINVSRTDCEMWHRGKISENLRDILKKINVNQEDVRIWGKPDSPEFLVEVFNQQVLYRGYTIDIESKTSYPLNKRYITAKVTNYPDKMPECIFECGTEKSNSVTVVGDSQLDTKHKIENEIKKAMRYISNYEWSFRT